jgi:hypothetical protein
MQKGAAMIHGWKADGKVQFEFHAEPAGFFDSAKMYFARPGLSQIRLLPAHATLVAFHRLIPNAASNK